MCERLAYETSPLPIYYKYILLMRRSVCDLERTLRDATPHAKKLN